MTDLMKLMVLAAIIAAFGIADAHAQRADSPLPGHTNMPVESPPNPHQNHGTGSFGVTFPWPGGTSGPRIGGSSKSGGGAAPFQYMHRTPDGTIRGQPG